MSDLFGEVDLGIAPKEFAGSSRAVMEDRAPKIVEGDDEITADWRARDFFPTPLWAARALAEEVLLVDPDLTDHAVDPCAGEGHMLFALDDYFAQVCAFDIKPDFPRVQGLDWRDDAGWDNYLAEIGGSCGYIIANPPFPLAADFVERGLRRSHAGVALLCRLSFAESAGRYPLFVGAGDGEKGNTPLTQLSIFVDRVPMVLGGWEPDASTATAYGAFIWSKRQKPRPTRWIPPGTKKRLTKPTDAALYGWT